MNNNLSLLAQQDYLRQRLWPKPGDEFYLHLSDLRAALETLRTDERITVLDFGCGGSPYRPLFPNADYRRADLAEVNDLDYIIDESGRIDAPDGQFDLVLSSQVLEHVPNPAAYLAECRRLLKPGGVLACSTHGTFEDHAVPSDFWRWTADGLARAVQDAGFKVKDTYKLTTGPRALVFLMERLLPQLDAPRKSLLRWCLRPLRWLLKTRRPYLHEMSDRFLAHHRFSTAASEHWAGQTYYIALLCVAQRPA